MKGRHALQWLYRHFADVDEREMLVGAASEALMRPVTLPHERGDVCEA